MELLKGVGILLLVLVLSYWASVNGLPFDWYLSVIGEEKSYSGFLANYAVLGEFFFNLIVTYGFFVALLFTSFKLHAKYWWGSILLLPVPVFFLWVGIVENVPLPLSLGFIISILVGWGIGLGLHKILFRR